MTTQRQAMCQLLGHIWTDWGPYEPIMPKAAKAAYVVAEAGHVPESEPIIAYRRRACRRCGCGQRQDWDGRVELETEATR